MTISLSLFFMCELKRLKGLKADETAMGDALSRAQK